MLDSNTALRRGLLKPASPEGDLQFEGYLDETTRRRLGFALRNLYEEFLHLPLPCRLTDLRDHLP
jgi:hypothetical protein